MFSFPPYLIAILLTVGSSLFFILSDSLSAHWGKTNSILSLYLVLITGPLAYITFGMLNQYKTLSVSSGLTNLIIILGNVLVSLLVFKEGMSLKEWIGMGFALVAVVLLGYK